MRTSRSYEGQYHRLALIIEQTRPDRRWAAAYDAGDFAEADRWKGLYLADENNEMNVADNLGRAPTTPADWRLMVRGLHGVLDGHGFAFRKGNRLVDVVAERAQQDVISTAT